MSCNKISALELDTSMGFLPNFNKDKADSTAESATSPTSAKLQIFYFPIFGYFHSDNNEKTAKIFQSEF